MCMLGLLLARLFLVVYSWCHSNLCAIYLHRPLQAMTMLRGDCDEIRLAGDFASDCFTVSANGQTYLLVWAGLAV